MDLGFIRHILRLCVAMLFSVLGASMAFAVPMTTSEITYFPTETTHFAQGGDVGFAARAPPIAAANVVVTGGVTVMQGSAFALHGQETVVALRGFVSDLNVTNRTIDADLVSFGRNANQVYHAWRHVDEIGMDRTAVRNAILDDVPVDLPDGFTSRVINVNGTNLEYRIFKLPDGSYNIGTVFEVGG